MRVIAYYMQLRLCITLVVSHGGPKVIVMRIALHYLDRELSHDIGTRVCVIYSTKPKSRKIWRTRLHLSVLSFASGKFTFLIILAALNLKKRYRGIYYVSHILDTMHSLSTLIMWRWSPCVLSRCLFCQLFPVATSFCFERNTRFNHNIRPKPENTT